MWKLADITCVLDCACKQMQQDLLLATLKPPEGNKIRKDIPKPVQLSSVLSPMLHETTIG